MTVNISERAFEDHIEAVLLAGSRNRVFTNDPRDANTTAKNPVSRVQERGPFYDMGFTPGGYLQRTSTDYDRALCLLPQDVYDFILATQPKTWQRLQEHHGRDTKERFLSKLAREIQRRGALDVLRNGIKERGVKFALAYFRPSSGLNEELAKLYHGNLFAVVRQLHYSQQNENSLDLALFLNGIPIFTAELKNPLTGRMCRMRSTSTAPARDPREPLLAYGRCLAHFAVDPDLVFVTTHLQGAQDALPAFQPGTLRRCGKPACLARAGGVSNRPICGTRSGPETACSI